jgi:tetratricopeptide (TPR) repeat protein
MDLWDDPSFQKQFLGSYGFQAEIEPRVTTVEREQMQKILPLLSSDPEGAAKQLEKITRPESSAVFDFTLGNVYFQAGDLERAAARYATALEKFPSFRRAHKNLGLIRVREGLFEDAVPSLSRVIELGGGDGLTYGLLGYAYASLAQHVSAESAFRNAVLLQPDLLDWKMGLAQSVLKQRKYREAVTLLQELITRHPDRSELWLLQANAWIGLEEPLEAAKNFEVARRMGGATLASLYTLGDIYVNEGLAGLASGAYEEAVRLDPAQDPGRPLRSAEALAQRGSLAQARSLLTTAKEVFSERLDEGQRRDILKMEARMAVAEGAGEEAAGVLEEVVALDPLDGEALLLLGQHYLDAGDPERAVFYFERAESIESYEADARLRHAQVLVAQARYGDAVPLLRRAQELEPRDEVARYLEQVERAARTRR